MGALERGESAHDSLLTVLASDRRSFQLWQNVPGGLLASFQNLIARVRAKTSDTQMMFTKERIKEWKNKIGDRLMSSTSRYVFNRV